MIYANYLICRHISPISLEQVHIHVLVRPTTTKLFGQIFDDIDGFLNVSIFMMMAAEAYLLKLGYLTWQQMTSVM